MVTAYTIYCDASGQPSEGDAIFVSGYGSTADNWLRFEERWNVLLRQYHIQPPFHMNEFAPGAGQYASWKGDKEARKKFFEKAIKVIKTNINKSFSVGVSVNDLKRMQTEYEVGDGIDNDTPYTFCAVLIYHQVKAWWKNLRGNPLDSIEFFFEQGDKDQNRFLNRLRGLYPTIEDPIFRKKDRCVPFQASDMLAWEHHRHALYGKLRSRGSYAELRKQIPHDRSWMYYDWAQLLRLCEKGRFPKRPESDLRSLTSRREHSIK